MTLKELKELESKAESLRHDASCTARAAKEAADLRANLVEHTARLDLEIQGISSWNHRGTTERVSNEMVPMLPAVLRTIELKLQADAKRLILQADALDSQIAAAIL